ncbi:MAG: hydroxyacid dehydrogenase, partial [Sphingobium sp.]|nr:hydroxyacid dehydrogenase [Sphingobium sp.]
MDNAQAKLIVAIRHRHGDKAVIDDADAVAPWLTDWRGRYQGKAAAILSPAA